MELLENEHPGIFLKEEFMEPLKITAYSLSKRIGVPTTRIDDIVSGKRAITADTAMRLSRYFGNSPQFWLNLQADYELRQLRRMKLSEYEKITPMDIAAA